MNCQILAIGQKMPSWCEEACSEYTKRLQRFLPVTCTEIPTSVRSKTANPDVYKAEEGQRILQKITPSDHVIALDVLGKAFSTPQLAKSVEQWRLQAKKVVFLIGGPDGLSKECLERANQSWSLSLLTFPHALVRVLLLEQLYRAASMLANHPYHRE